MRPDLPPYGYRSDGIVPPFADDRPIIVFDGHCALCVGWIRFVMWCDRDRRFRFLPAQSALGRAIYAHYGLDTTSFETNILLTDGRARFKLDGSIGMAAILGFPWSLAKGLRFLPESWRDAFYDLVARNRFGFFGRRNVCHRPASGDADRFLA